MEDNKKVDRLSIMRNILIIAFVVIASKAGYMTIFKHEHYNELAENKTYKELPIKAPRGEIRDRYGRLLAGNKNLFTVQVSYDGINRKDSQNKSMTNEISLKIIDLLEKNKETYIDEFPIYMENGKYYYTFDKNIRDFKKNYNNKEGIPQNLNAKESFYYIVDKLINEGVISKEDRNLEPSKLQKKLNENGEYPPILVSKWMFTEQKNKQDWLLSYKNKNTNITDNTNAKNAFKELRKYYEIDENLSDEDARKIFIVRDLIKSQGYSKYNPVTIAKDISEKTMSQIEERAMELSGISVAREPVRYYPQKTLASHTIGHMGKMSAESEKEYLQREPGKKKYLKGDSIGIAGVEKNFEEQLKGIDGYQKVQVDALGKVTKELDRKDPQSGETVYLTIDKDLQKETEDALKSVVQLASRGGTYKSKFGNYNISKVSPNAKSGAIIAIDVKTGEVLSMASYPNYDPNKFINGISYEDYKDLQPTNPNDVLGANPQVNLATHGAFQPGSTFKMVTGMASIDNGLSPKYAINDPGKIQLGNRPFADYTWHKTKRNHGYTDLYKAIQESCNVYFYTLASGKNWNGGKDPQVKIGPEGVLEYAKKFGLDDYTGLNKEVGERIGRVPTVEGKIIATKSLLRNALTREMSNDFIDISKEKNKVEYEERIEQIVSWIDEDKKIGREEAIERLSSMKVKENRVEPIADMVVFDYLNSAKWTTADTFNLAIGQGEIQTTPAQIARYVAAIANGGDLLQLSVIDRIIASNYSSVEINENEKEKIDFKDNENLKHLTEGMKLVTTQGTGKSVFKNFPIKVAAKTGTAEKSGKIPTPNEYEYLESHMASYGVKKEDAVKLAEKMKKEAEKELSKEKEIDIKEKLKDNNLDEKEKNKLKEELEDGIKVKLENTSKVNALYLRKAIKELNPKINDDKIDQYKQNYRSFSWSVGFAPADNPEIAVVAVIPQGESSSYSMLLVREVMGNYFGINDDKTNKTEKKEEVSKNESNKEEINFDSKMKK